MQTPRMGSLPIPQVITSRLTPLSVEGCPGPGLMTTRSRSPASNIACCSYQQWLSRTWGAQTHLDLLDGDLVISLNERISTQYSDIGVYVPGEGIVIVNDECIAHLERERV